MNSFAKILEIHTELDEMFLEHQYALLHFDFALALEKLERYESVLLAHMADEEDVLLPLYAERAVIGKGGAVKLFLDEHEKMRNFVRLFAEATASLQTDPEPEPTLLQLLDRESFYKRLNTHHDIRETDILYPALDVITSVEERAEIYKRISAHADTTHPSPTAA
jgi:iron-sulfur cluster repair protein YtfE (RIC family)